MSVVPFPGLTLCPCSKAIAVLPISGGLVCEACYEAQRTRNIPSAEYIFVEPPEETKLDDILAVLTKAAP